MKLLPILILTMLLVPLVASAQCDLENVDTECYALSGDPCYDLYYREEYCAVRICCIVVAIGRWLYFVAAGIAIIIVVYAGISYMTAGSNEEQAKKAKKVLIYGLIGAGIVMASGFILNILIELLV